MATVGSNSQGNASETVSQTRAETLPGALLELAREFPDRVALREKKLGVWNPMTYAKLRDRVALAARWLIELGVKPGAYVGIFSANRSEWLIAEQAIMLTGAVSLGIHPETYVEELNLIFEKGQVNLILCGDQEQVDRLRDSGLRRPPARWIVFDSRGTRQYDEERLLFWEDALPVATAPAADAPHAGGLAEYFEELAARLDPDAICVAVSSLGSADYPRHSLFNHRTLFRVTDEFARIYKISGRDRNLCYMPLCHYVEKLFSAVMPLRAGNMPHIVESDETVLEDLREVSPTVFASWPKFWDRIHLMTLFRMSHTSLVREFFFDSFTRAGADRVKFTPGASSLTRRLGASVGDLLFFRALQNRLGLRDCRIAFSTGGELKEHVIQWFLGWGVPLTEFYGTAETMGAGFSNAAGSEGDAGTGGRPFAELRFRFARDRELMLKGPYLFSGYLGAQDSGTNADGWFLTDDMGFEDARDRLRLTGNKYTVIENADKEKFSIKRTEEVMRECPYVREIVCFGENLPFVSALIELDFERTSEEVRLENVRFKKYEDLLKAREVTDLLQKEISRLNEDLIEVEKVRAFRFFPTELHEENGELAFDYAPRRLLIARKYKSLIDRMYESAAESGT